MQSQKKVNDANNPYYEPCTEPHAYATKRLMTHANIMHIVVFYACAAAAMVPASTTTNTRMYSKNVVVCVCVWML